MFQFDSKLSFYIPVVFPKHAKKYFIQEAFENYHIGSIKHIELTRCKEHYKAYIYFDWIENDMTRGIQKQILGKNKQTFFTFNPTIKNGYWIVRKNVENKKNTSDKKIIESLMKEVRSVKLSLLEKDKELEEKDILLEKKEKVIKYLREENDEDVEFFENKISELNKRIEDLETYYYNNYISSDDETEEEEESEEEEYDDDDKQEYEDNHVYECEETETDDDEEEDDDDEEEADEEESSETDDDDEESSEEEEAEAEEEEEEQSQAEEQAQAQAEEEEQAQAEAYVEAEERAKEHAEAEAAEQEEAEQEEQEEKNEDNYSDDEFMLL